MGIVRDFTEPAKQKLLSSIEIAEAQREGWLGLNKVKDWITDFGIDCDISHYQDIEDYYNAIMDKHNTTREALEKIWTDVYVADGNYPSQMKVAMERIMDIQETMESFTNIMDTAPANGSAPMLSRTPTEFNQALTAGIQKLYEDILGKLVYYDIHGELAYDWHGIDAILDKDPDDITELEYLILATLYAGMNLKDTENFLIHLADKVGDVHEPGSVQFLVDVEDYTIWTYNSDKVHGIQKYIDAMITTITGQQWILHEQGASTSDIDALDPQRRSLLEKSAFLTVVVDLSNRLKDNAGTGEALSYYADHAELTGRAGAIGPLITLTQNKTGDGYSFTFCNERGEGNPNGGYLQFGRDDRLHENTISISNALSGESAREKVTNNASSYWNSVYSYNFLRDTAPDITISVTTLAVGTLFTSAIPETPATIIPSVLLTGGELGLGAIIKKNDMEQKRDKIQSSFDTIGLANYYKTFHFDVVVVNDTYGKQQVITTPNYLTGDSIDTLITEVRQGQGSKPLESFPFDFTVNNPITLDDVVNRYDDIKNLIDNGLSEAQKSRIFGL